MEETDLPGNRNRSSNNPAANRLVLALFSARATVRREGAGTSTLRAWLPSSFCFPHNAMQSMHMRYSRISFCIIVCLLRMKEL